MKNISWIKIMREPACSFVVSKDPNCKCASCQVSHEKCARLGCDRRKANGSDFCLTCAGKGLDRPSTTCDNLTAMRDPQCSTRGCQSPKLDGFDCCSACAAIIHTMSEITSLVHHEV